MEVTSTASIGNSHISNASGSEALYNLRLSGFQRSTGSGYMTRDSWKSAFFAQHAAQMEHDIDEHDGEQHDCNRCGIAFAVVLDRLVVHVIGEHGGTVERPSAAIAVVLFAIMLVY